MRKLQLDDLAVESFVTASEPFGAGTVHGNEDTVNYCTKECGPGTGSPCLTVLQMCTLDDTCRPGDSCAPSCWITECNGGSGTGTQVYTCANTCECNTGPLTEVNCDIDVW